MKKYFLGNGLVVIEEKRKSDSVSVQLTVKAGSNFEKEGIRGVSHFIEHMVFEGTKNRKTAKEISNEIESLGGEINAYTNNIRTCFYIKVPKKHFEKALEIISDIIKNPLFRERDIDKERGVILKEINIFNDESRFFQWILFQKLLFGNSPYGYPAFGTYEDVKKISRQDILSFFSKYYFAGNTIISVVGDFNNSEKIIKKYFSDFRKGKVKLKKLNDDIANKKKYIKVKRKNTNSYMVLGYKTANRLHNDSYVLDIIQAILGKGQSGRIFDEVRNKSGLAYEVGVYHECDKNIGFFAVYLSTDKKNIGLIKKLILKEFEKLKNISQEELKHAIGYVEGKYLLDNENTHNKADELGYWELIKNTKLEKNYLKKIRKVSVEGVARVAKKYLTKNYSLAIIEQK